MEYLASCCLTRNDKVVQKHGERDDTVESTLLLAPHRLTSTDMQCYEWDIDHWESSIRLNIVDDILASAPQGSMRRLESRVPPFGDVAKSDLLRAHSSEVVDLVVGLAMGASEESLGLSDISKQLAIDSFFKAASSSGLVDEERTSLLQHMSRASLTAVSTVLQLADEVMRNSTNARLALAPVRPAGHHSLISKFGLMCGLNSVMVAALKYASKGINVGVFDIDVHCGGGTHDIAMRWNRDARKMLGFGRVFLADVYAYMFDDEVMRQRADEQNSSVDSCAEFESLCACCGRSRNKGEFDSQHFSSFHGTLKARPFGQHVERFSIHKNKKKKSKPEAGWEVPARPDVPAGCGDLLFFEHSPDDLTDSAIVEHTRSVVSYFQQNEVKIIFVALGLDAAQGDNQPGEITPEGYRQAARVLRNSGLPVVLALEGGYNTQSDVARREVESPVDSVFGKSIKGIVQGLTETL